MSSDGSRSRLLRAERLFRRQFIGSRHTGPRKDYCAKWYHNLGIHETAIQCCDDYAYLAERTSVDISTYYLHQGTFVIKVRMIRHDGEREMLSCNYSCPSTDVVTALRHASFLARSNF